VVTTAEELWLDFSRKREFFYFKNVLTRCGAHPGSYLVGTGAFFTK
jgi:hypothetical protein